MSGRGAAYTLALIAADPQAFGAASVAAESIADAIRPWVAAESNPNFPTQPGVLTTTAIAGARTERSDRLARIRHHYDPDGVFA